MTGIALLGVMVAATLLYSGIKGYDPRSLITSVFTGNPPTPLSGATTTNTGGGVQSAGSGIASCEAQWGNVPLVTYSNGTPGGVRLQPTAMDAFKAAEQKAGTRIILTGSYRTCAAEWTLSHAKPTLGTGSDPGASYHVRGLAIDVNDNMLSPAITAALLASGWAQFDASKEPWHFSYGGVG